MRSNQILLNDKVTSTYRGLCTGGSQLSTILKISLYLQKLWLKSSVLFFSTRCTLASVLL